MAITVEGTPTTAQGDGTSAVGTVPTVAGGILADDFIVMHFASCEAEDNTTGIPTGMDGEWLPELQVGDTPPSIPGMQVFYELAAGGESGTRTATLSFASGWMITMFVLRGVDTVTPLDVSNETVQSTSNGYPDPPSITPTNDDCLILALGLKDETGADTLTSHPSGYTGIDWNNNNQSTGGTMMSAYLIQGTAAAEDPGAWAGTGGNDEWCAATMAFRPGATSGLDQEGYRWYADGTESGSVARQNQDTVDTVERGVTVQLRTLLDATGDPASEQFLLEYKETGDPDSEYRQVPLT